MQFTDYSQFDDDELDGLGFSFSVKNVVRKATNVVRKVQAPAVNIIKRTTPGAKLIDRALVKADQKITRPLIRHQNAITDRALVALDKNVTRRIAKPLKPWASKLERGVANNLDKIAIVAAVVPGLQAAAPYLRAAAVARKVAIAHKNMKAAARAQAQYAKQKNSMIADITGSGFSPAQAATIIGNAERGISVQDAIKLAGPPAHAAAVQKEAAQWKERTSTDPKRDLLNWLKEWRPDVHDNVIRRMGKRPLSGIESGQRIDWDTGDYTDQPLNGLGEGDWLDTVGSWAGTVWDAAKNVISSPTGQAVLQNQLQRAMGGYAPAPTPVVQQEAAAGVAPTVGAPVPGVAPVNAGGASSMMMPLIGVGALAFLALR